MAVTPVGNPYVESSDRVSDYPGASEALAERIDIVGVNPFANAAARTAAIPSPTEGMMSSLNDTDSVQRYDGAAWKPVGGKVLQVVMGTHSTQETTNTGSYVDTGLTATITPSASGNKILVLVSQTGLYKTGGNAYLALQLLRDATSISEFEKIAGFTGTSTDNSVGGSGVSYLDSPNTTSATIYKTQFKRVSAVGSVITQHDGSMSTIILIEVAA